MNFDNEKETLPLPLFVLRLRSLILALGESSDPAWWQTRFMNETGLRFLERLYPRTSFRAAVHAAGKAACDNHDRAVGRVGVYHLFRLPEHLEAEMNKISISADADFVPMFREALGNHDRLMELLTPLCGQREGDGATAGARRIGADRDLTKLSTFKITAASYHSAFSQGKPGFPYFSSD